MASCACGCGGETKTIWVRGHHSRVNNISKRPDIREKRKQRMQEWHDSGGWQPWNKGLTVDDPRVKKNIQDVIEKRGENWKINAGNSLRKNRQTFTKDKHPAWKGGTSTLIRMLRADYALYKFWKHPILIRDKFTCQDCEQKGNLHIHHDKEKMCDIVAKYVSENKHELSYEEKKQIIHQIVQYHVEGDVSGVSLCRTCHKKRHLENKDKD